MALILRGVKTVRMKAKRLASIRLSRECCPLTSKDVQGSAIDCKIVEGAGSQFWEAEGSRRAAPANSKHAVSTGTESLKPSAVKK
jgi:hypothetical protein